jgi:hypothetical protein
MTLQKRGNNIDLVMTGSNRELFTSSDNGFISPANFNATLELTGKDTEDEKYVLTRNTSGEIFIFYGFSKQVPQSVRGKLHERSNTYYYAQGLTGETYSYDSRGLVDLIVTASPQAYAIRYTYNTTGIAVNRLHKIEVFDSLNADDSSKKLSEVVFTYWEEVNDAHQDVGEFGDLVQVKVSKLLSDNVSYQTRITQYRYHRTDIDAPNTDIDDGISHQLKLVLESAAIERLLAENSELTKPEDILKKSDTENLGNNNSVYGASSRSFSYYVANLDTDANIVTSWGTENFASQYGGENLAEIYQMPDETPIPRLKTERINAGCFACGGSEGGIQKTYFYLALNSKTRTQESPNAVTNLIVEDSQDSSGTPYQRTIYALNSRGVELRQINIENPVAQTLSTYATSTILTDKRKVLEERVEDSHLLIQSNALVKQFLNPYDPSNSSWANDTATLEPNRGVIDVFEYDAKNNQTASKRKSGASGTAYYVSATDFDDKRHPVAEHRYPSKTASRDIAERSTTRFEYSFWDAKQKVIKIRKTIRPAIPETQNGTGETAVTD